VAKGTADCTHRRGRTGRLVVAVVLAVGLAFGALAGSPVPAGALTSTAASRLAELRATAVVPGSDSPIAVAAASALDALLQRRAGNDPGNVADLRTALAVLVAEKAKVDAATLDSVWASTDDGRLIALFAALGQVGVAYRTFQSKPGIGFDCSGLTTFAWSVAGVTLKRSSSPQIAALPRTTVAEIRPADIIWYPGHVSMALGVGSALVHSPYTGKTVEIRAVGRVVRVGSPVLPDAGG
jgi:cell wall-associated NlpC family hydrolase